MFLTHLKILTIVLLIFGFSAIMEGNLVQTAQTTLEANVRQITPWQPKVRDPQPITLVAFGDLMLGRYVEVLSKRYGQDYAFEYFPALLEYILQNGVGPTHAPHFLFANLEGPISDSTYVNPGTAMVFNFKPLVTDTLKKYGFNLLSLANNHAYDMGPDNARQTREYLTDAYIHYFGDAKEISEETTWSTTVNDTTLAFVGFNDTVKDRLNYERAQDLIRSLEADHDFTIVSIHWGTEYRTTPTETQVEQAHAMIDAGADVILGHHPHVIESSEWYHGRPIYYSLGNFVFDQYFQQNVQEGLAVKIVLKKPAIRELSPTVQASEFIFDILKSKPQLRATPQIQ